MRHYLAVFLAFLVLAAPWILAERPAFLSFANNLMDSTYEQLASVIISHNPKTVEQIKEKYKQANIVVLNSASKDLSNAPNKVKILLVPGHEPGFGGTEFGELKEREMNVELAKYLNEYLSYDKRYEIFMARDNQSWNIELERYFKEKWSEIIEWQKTYRQELNRLSSLGDVYIPQPIVHHNNAPKDAALRLYGITKWSNENDVDVILHIHFNDYPRRNARIPGEYSGFSIYVPTEQFKNSSTTKNIAQKIFSRFEKYNPVSNLKGEDAGIVDGAELIAIGANNTSDAPSMLVEYGYIYEPQFTNDSLRSLTLKDLAYQTYLGLQDFFEAKEVFSDRVGIVNANVDNNNQRNIVANMTFGTSILPYLWDEKLDSKSNTPKAHRDIFALQTALMYEGVYPPSGMNKNNCPRSGMIGACTKKALESFQKLYGITDEVDIVGPKTRKILNAKYSVREVQ